MGDVNYSMIFEEIYFFVLLYLSGLNMMAPILNNEQ